jgi:hypothetical protein
MHPQLCWSKKQTTNRRGFPPQPVRSSNEALDLTQMGMVGTGKRSLDCCHCKVRLFDFARCAACASCTRDFNECDGIVCDGPQLPCDTTLCTNQESDKSPGSDVFPSAKTCCPTPDRKSQNPLNCPEANNCPESNNCPNCFRVSHNCATVNTIGTIVQHCSLLGKQMKTYRAFGFLVAWMAMQSFACAHPGHGDRQLENTVVHYVVSPMHLLPILLAAMLVLCLIRWRTRTKQSMAHNRFGMEHGHRIEPLSDT